MDGRCGRCGRLLRSEKSILNGMGRACKRKQKLEDQEKWFLENQMTIDEFLNEASASGKDVLEQCIKKASAMPTVAKDCKM